MDHFFLQLVEFLRGFPCIVVSFFSFIFCSTSLVFLRRRYGYVGLCCYMAICSVIANIQILYAVFYEIVNIPALLGTIIFCTSFLACDMINEHYDSDKAKKAVYLSFVLQLFFIGNILLTLGHKPLDYNLCSEFSIPESTMNQNVNAIRYIFIPMPRLFLASCLAYLLSQLSEIFVFNFLKTLSWIKSYYIKQNLSLFISAVVVDTLVFTGIGLVIFSEEPLSFHDFLSLCCLTVVMRIIFNLGNTAVMKLDMLYTGN